MLVGVLSRNNILLHSSSGNKILDWSNLKAWEGDQKMTQTMKFIWGWLENIDQQYFLFFQYCFIFTF